MNSKRIRYLIRLSSRIGFCALMGFGGVASAQSDPVAAFYKAHPITIVVGFSAGGGYDLNARTIGRYIKKYIPGTPNVIISNMPGAGSLRATGYLANVAPRDGSVIGILNPVNVIEPLIDPRRTKFDPRQFNWLGSLSAEFSTCGFWAKDIKTLKDLKRRQIVVAATGPSSGSMVDTLILKELLGINFKVVSGYPGLTEVRMAAERGEVDGMCGLLFSAIKVDSWEAFKAGTVSVPVQYGLSNHPELANVPNAYDLVVSDEDRQLFKLIVGPQAFGRPLMAPPDTPTDRVAALRLAFKNTVVDPAFLNEVKRLNIDIQPVEPAAIAELVDEIFRTSPAIVEKARVLLSVDSR